MQRDSWGAANLITSEAAGLLVLLGLVLTVTTPERETTGQGSPLL